MTDARERMAQFIAAQRESYTRGLFERVAAIEALWAAALGGDDAQAKLIELHRLAHTIHGAAGTYGFPDASRQAHALEDAVRPLIAPVVAEGEPRERVAAAIAALRASLPDVSPPAPP